MALYDDGVGNIALFNHSIVAAATAKVVAAADRLTVTGYQLTVSNSGRVTLHWGVLADAQYVGSFDVLLLAPFGPRACHIVSKDLGDNLLITNAGAAGTIDGWIQYELRRGVAS